MGDSIKYKDESISFYERARDLVSRMSLEEKVTQMSNKSPAIKRLGIKSYNWWNEALHGVARAGVATMFPQAIAMAATFDKDLMKKIGDIISTEARAKYNEFQKKGDHDIYKGLTFWSPNINIFRDPRWGRGHETYGEDVFLTGLLACGFIRGLQGNNDKYLKTAACVKHFAVHSGPEELRHSFDAIVSKKDLWETYLPAFEKCIKETNVEAVMGAYNRVNGEACCGSKTLLNDILREKWGFKGHVVSDCWAIGDFHNHHKVTKTAPESAALAVNNGCDLNCGNMYGNLLIAHQEGLIEESKIDESVIRLMHSRMKLGMFDSENDNPYNNIPFEKNDCKEHKEFSIEVSKRSLVLLKNNEILPLDRSKINSIAVIGPNADSRTALIGNYFGTASEHVTVLEGIRENVHENTRIYFAEGCHLYKNQISSLAEPDDYESEALTIAEKSDVIIMCLGLDSTIEGEEGDVSNEYASGDKKDLNLPAPQERLLKKVHQTGKPIILLLLSGSALSVTWADENIPAIVQGWYPGALGGRAIASMLFGDFSPSGKLPVTFYKTTEELPDFEDYSMENRTYKYMKNESLYPFGYGLSYTKFEYSSLSQNSNKVNKGKSLEVSFEVENSGNYPSYETVQLYIKDVEASVKAPRWQLADVNVIYLKQGEKRNLKFVIKPEMMEIVDYDGNRIIENGMFEFYIGGSQPDNRSFKLTKTKVLRGEFEII